MTIEEVAALGARIERLEGMRRRVVENLLRRVAHRRGMEVQRSRCRDPVAPDHGRYRVCDYTTRQVVAGGGPKGYALDLADVARFLADQARVEAQAAVRMPGTASPRKRAHIGGHGE
jgi:hypothetical protein